MWIWPDACPELNSIILGDVPDVLSGLYQTQTENADPNVIWGILKNCLSGFVTEPSPPVCARNATFCRSVMLPATDTMEPVFASGPVTPVASTRKAFGWNG